MDGITIAQEVLTNLWIEPSEDREQAEMLPLGQILSIGGRALELHLSRCKLDFKGSSLSCLYGKRKRFVELPPKKVATLLGTVTIKQGFYRCGDGGTSCFPYEEWVGLRDVVR